ncbi:sensor histidine kinase, partial [Spirochaetota bacterium]
VVNYLSFLMLQLETREIHHRVKNNFQIIMSLLNLQESNIEDEKSLKVLREPINRINTMALIHERLYQTDNLSSLDFGEYVKKISMDLFESYMCDPGKVAMKINVDKCELDVDQAVPCGLIINEVISNSIKYAFPDDWGKPGVIKVILKEKGDEQVELVLGDDGIGMPDSIVVGKAETLGLNLVPALVKQVKGEYELKRSRGTEFKISFKKNL